MYWRILCYHLVIKDYQKDSEKHALSALDDVDLSNFKSSSVTTLSGGEAQRVGIARALAMNTKIILADEPTGNLDKDTSNSIVNSLVDVCKMNKVTLVVVSHMMILFFLN